MSELPSMMWVTGLVSVISVISAIAVSPVLAGWTAGLTTDVDAEVPWWHPRRVPAQRVILVAAVAAVLAACAAAGRPFPAWWLFAAGRAAQCIVDVQLLLNTKQALPLSCRGSRGGGPVRWGAVQSMSIASLT